MQVGAIPSKSGDASNGQLLASFYEQYTEKLCGTKIFFPYKRVFLIGVYAIGMFRCIYIVNFDHLITK